MNPRIIGLCGDIGSGKDTVAEYLVRAHGYTHVGFSMKLKLVAVDVYGLEDRHVFGTQEEKSEPIPHVVDGAGDPRTGRDILELLAEQGFRAIDPGTWLKYAMRTWVDAQPDRRWVFSDTRYRNEIHAIRERGGLVWEVAKVGGPEPERRGHRSDKEWRAIPRDNIVAARFGDMVGLEQAVDRALMEGTLHQDLRHG